MIFRIDLYIEYVSITYVIYDPIQDSNFMHISAQWKSQNIALQYLTEQPTHHLQADVTAVIHSIKCLQSIATGKCRLEPRYEY